MRQNSHFRLPRGHRFCAKIGSYGYGDKSRWGPPRVHLGVNGVPLDKKMGQNRKKLPCPKIRIFDYPAVIDFLQKMEVTVVAPSHGGDPVGSLLGPMGSHWVQKMFRKRTKLPCTKIQIFDYPTVIDFSQKNESYGYGDKSRWGLPRVHHGANGSHWVQKMGQKRRKLPCPEIRIFDYPAVIDFWQKMIVTVMAPNQGVDPVGSILRPMGSHWVQKMGQNSKKLPCPKIRIFDYPAIIDFSLKMEVTVLATNHGGDPLGSILGSMGSHWVEKMGQKRKKLPCPKIQIFNYHAIIDFSQKWKLRLWCQITVGTPWVLSWGQWGPIGSKKWVKTVQNYHAPKFAFSTTLRSSIFCKQWKLWLWR